MILGKLRAVLPPPPPPPLLLPPIGKLACHLPSSLATRRTRRLCGNAEEEEEDMEEGVEELAESNLL